MVRHCPEPFWEGEREHYCLECRRATLHVGISPRMGEVHWTCTDCDTESEEFASDHDRYDTREEYERDRDDIRAQSGPDD